jgi:hypothetical protein
MIDYIPGDIFRASFKFCMGDKLRGKMEGVKRIKLYSVHFIYENFRSPFQNEILHQERSQYR